MTRLRHVSFPACTPIYQAGLHPGKSSKRLLVAAGRRRFAQNPGSGADWVAETGPLVGSLCCIPLQMSVYVTGDFNIRLDRPDDPHAALQLRLLVDCCGLVLHDTGPTHQLGRTLDAVITHDKNGRPASVAVTDVGLSDHFLLRWEVNTIRDSPTPVHVCSRQ